ncbi:hypothetical protein [Vibrio nigripulchritudo]|uniref:hypothetical protein n=1 Tax=Vibrio nigripulchritudo TaxID=28173 RepID=UPI0005F9FC6E|nr:hypothetical protein [Vibrio nigripulchritudo]KJY80865.1 hypothetical protein TW74_00790 [Vibrio nigripulchritudo]
MNKYKILFEFKQPWFISELSASKCNMEDELKLWFQVECDEDCRSIRLEGVEDLDLVSSLLQAEKIIISQELMTQKELGTIRVECWVDGSYSEFWCNEFED